MIKNKNSVDFHIHTNNSDGEHSIQELLIILEKNNITMFSFTDHDNIDAYSKLQYIKVPEKISVITGVEFSTIMNGINCHILGYYVDINNRQIKELCLKIQKLRFKRMEQLIGELENKFKIVIHHEDKKNILLKSGTIGKPELLKLLVKYGYGNKSDIYKNYINKLHSSVEYRQDITEIISTIKAAGGIPILAHPKEIEDEYNISIDMKIEEFINNGILGIEVYNSLHNDVDNLKIKY